MSATPNDYDCVAEEVDDCVRVQGMRDTRLILAAAIEFNAKYECSLKRSQLRDMVAAQLLVTEVSDEVEARATVRA